MSASRTGGRLRRTALTATAVLLGAAGVSYATTLATAEDALSVIHACQAKNGVLRAVAAPADCDKKYETPISWNAQGPAGPAGANGAAGPKGDAGAQGAAGPQGPAGQDGAAGKDGAPGAQGAPGAKGDQGDKGDKGDRGLQGLAGANGVDGSTGPQGLQGNQGLKGDQGAKGDRGEKGETGATGPQGQVGAQGPAGASGVASLVSPDGRFRLTLDNNGIAMEGYQLGGIRLTTEGINIVGPGGLDRLKISPTEMYFLSAQGTGLSLINGGALLSGKQNMSLDLGATVTGVFLKNTDSSGVQFLPNAVTMFGAGAGIGMGRNQFDAPQLDLGANTIQMSAGKIGLGGFCRGIVREDIDLVRNSYSHYGPLNAGGWQYGIVDDASTVAYAC